MTNIEALEKLVGSRILAVELYPDGASAFEAKITTTDGDVVCLIATDEGMLSVEVTDVS